MRCSDIYGNTAGDWNGDLAPLADINGNFSKAPAFCNYDAGDFHLSKFSPCAPQFTICFSDVPIGALGIGCDEDQICGDLDEDGDATVADLELATEWYIELNDFYFYPTQWRVLDMDCDGVITIADIVMLAGYIYGYGPLPCCAPPPKRIDLPGREASGGL